MNPERQQAIQYLRAPADGCWRWAEKGEVVAWRDGATIAFRPEIERIIEWLAPGGLPPFGALVFLLAAARGKIPSVNDVLGGDGPLPTGTAHDLLRHARVQLRVQLEAALDELRKVNGLPAEVQAGLNARCVLAEAVFEPAKAERQVDARSILPGLREPLSDEELLDPTAKTGERGCLRQIHIVASGLKLHTPDSLRLRLQTGLDALPRAGEVNLSAAEQARRLIEELARDRELGAVARAARDLMAAVRLPRRLGEREQMALGGVSDITNRGPLDRLLLSELAHDDLTLATRVALNEALYLRREPPLREPPGTLALLLDSGVRLWGLPRVFATAVALALIARGKPHGQVMSWRASGKQLQPADLLSRDGLARHLAVLETDAHTGAAVPALAAAMPAGTEIQSVLITHRDALDDPEFRRALGEQPVTPGFVAVVDHAGRFELHATPLSRRPPVCAAELDPGALFDDQPGVSPINHCVEPDLPAIFGVRPFPFLLPLAGRIDTWSKSADGWFYVMLNDRRLARMRDEKKGAHELADELPRGKTIWMEQVGETIHAAKGGASQRPTRLISYPLPAGPPRVTDLASGPELLAVQREGEVILLIREHEIRAYSLGDGRMLARLVNPLRWIRGRYFRGDRQFHFAAWNGVSIKLEPVTMAATIPLAEVVLLFDRAGMSGPWVLLRTGEVISSETGASLELPYRANLDLSQAQVKVSRDGRQLFLPAQAAGDTTRRQDYLLNLPSDAQQTSLKWGAEASAVFDPAPIFPRWNLFRIVEWVARLPDGLAICGHKGHWRKLVLNDGETFRLADLSAADKNQLQNPISFAAGTRLAGHCCTLHRAEWPGGSKVFLDSRGLLHLKSHDPRVAEVSLVLSDGTVAGWTSEGHQCGHEFFFESTAVRVASSLVARAVQRFLDHV